MRDRIIARRAFCALVAGIAVAFAGSGGALAAQSPGQSHRKEQPRLARRPRALRIVAIDPGHGGVDPGAISPHGHYEKDLTLSAARELARQLDATGRFRAVLTRSRDTFVPLRERVAEARARHAELFVSVHADALPDTEMR